MPFLVSRPRKIVNTRKIVIQSILRSFFVILIVFLYVQLCFFLSNALEMKLFLLEKKIVYWTISKRKYFKTVQCNFWTKTAEKILQFSVVAGLFFYTLASKLWTIRRCLTLLWAYWTTMYIEISTHKFVSKWLVNLLNDSITNRISIFFYSHHRIAKRDEHRMTSIHAINGHTHTEPTTTKNPTHQNQIRKQRVHHKKKTAWRCHRRKNIKIENWRRVTYQQNDE